MGVMNKQGNWDAINKIFREHAARLRLNSTGFSSNLPPHWSEAEKLAYAYGYEDFHFAEAVALPESELMLAVSVAHPGNIDLLIIGHYNKIDKTHKLIRVRT
jgi:hypothetical protein